MGNNILPTNDIIKISAVGDMMLGIAYLQSAKKKQNILERLKNEPKSILKEVEPFLSNSDITFGNLECVISNDFHGDFEKDPNFIIAPAKALELLNYGNFNIINLANNHILDHGKKKAMETKKLLEEQNIQTIGSPNSNTDEMVIFEIKNKKIGFLGYNLCPVGSKKVNVTDMVKSIKKNSGLMDITIVSVHWGWGYEHMTIPAPHEISIGHKIIDSGADIVLGHHSHVLQPIELYKDKLIAYSLGNFIFDMWRKENRIGAILEISIDTNNNISINIIPSEQINYQIKLKLSKSEELNKYLIFEKIKSETYENYRSHANKKRKKHQKEVLNYYLANFYKFSLKINLFYLNNLKSTFIERTLSIFKRE
jgi:gamma-polyglutamate biosynthesis protein CapA